MNSFFALSLFLRVPAVLNCVTVLAGDFAQLYTMHFELRVGPNIRDVGWRAALRANQNMLGLLRCLFELSHARFKCFDAGGQLFHGLPDRGFVEDFQNV